MILMSRPSITSLEERNILKALDDSFIGYGPFIEEFEELWAKKNKRKYGVSCNSGTNALYIALKALGIGPGDEVIVPEYTMIATAWAVSYTGATPVFVDCKDDLNMDYSKLKITEKTKAIIVVPIYGRKTQCDFVQGIGAERIPVIGDYAEAHGIIPPENVDIACYSFYGNKILTTGEGGMCITNNKEYASEMRNISNMYMDEKHTYMHKKQGHNFRMTNLQAAIGVAQVMRMDEILEKREKIQDLYDKYVPEGLKMPRREVLWLYDIQTDDSEEKKRTLEINNVSSRYGFKPMSMQPQYEKKYDHLNAYRWSKRILCLPVWTDMTESDIIKITKSL